LSIEASFADAIAAIEMHVRGHPENTDTVITEMLYLLSKCGTPILGEVGRISPDVDTDTVLTRIRKQSQITDLKIPDVRFRAVRISKTRGIPLPEATRKHREPLMQWFDTHWDMIAADIAGWKDQEPGIAGD
jgi:hypothetical protein